MSNLTYSLSALEAAITHALGGSPPASGNSAANIVNQAIQKVWLAQQWTFRERPFTVNLSGYNLISPGGTGAWPNYNPTVNANVTGSAAWAAAGYPPIYRDGTGLVWVFLTAHGLTSGQYISIQGANTSTGDNYPFNCNTNVNSTPDANTFTFYISGQPGAASQDITAPATGGGAGYGSMVPGDYQLPTDFAGLKSLGCFPGNFRVIGPTAISHLVELRQFNYVTTWTINYAVSSVPQTAPNVEPRYVMTFFPVPTIINAPFAQGYYYRRIPQLVNPTDVPDVQSTFQQAIYHYARAIAVMTEFERISPDMAEGDKLIEVMKQEDGINQQPSGHMVPMVSTGDRRSITNPNLFPLGLPIYQ